MRKRIFDIIQIGNKSDLPSTLYDYFITVVIILNLVVTFWLTFRIPSGTMERLKVIEFVTMCIFTVEFLLRIWTAKFLYPDKNAFAAILKYLISFYGLIDIFTILPYFLPVETLYGMGALRIIRVVRIFRLFRSCLGSLPRLDKLVQLPGRHMLNIVLGGELLALLLGDRKKPQGIGNAQIIQRWVI